MKKRKVDEPLRCTCGEVAPWLTEVNGRWIGPCCVPKERWAMYRGWKEREQTRQKRAKLARKNFRLAEVSV